jgi:hypothetical protein
MARWQRDPRARRNVAWVLVAVETVLLSANVWAIFSAYLHQLNFRLSQGRETPLMSTTAALAVDFAVVAACIAGAVALGFLYVRGRAWPRFVYMGANVVVLAMGVVWFVHDRMGTSPDPMVGLIGLVAPLLTLFPLLWPLLVFRPTMPLGAGPTYG